jgi:hypothetical protein
MLTIGVAAWLASAGLNAQTRPDFSGRWTSDPEPAPAAPAAAAPATPDAARGAGPQRGGGPAGTGRGGGRAADMGSGWGPTITITQTAERLTVEYAFFARGDMQPPLRFAYALDGSETKNSVMMGRGIQVQTSRSKWDADKLVITTTHTFTNPETGKPMTQDVTQTLTLQSPTSLVVETARAGVLGGAATVTKTAYRKI